MIVLYSITTAAAALLAVTFFLRKASWDDFLAGNATISDLDDSDNLVAMAALLQIGLFITGAIVTSIWARRIAQNAQARGAQGIKVGMATGGWFIPIGFFWLGFGQLRKSSEAFGRQVDALQRWQALFIAQSLIGTVTRNMGEIDESNPSTVADSLRNQWMLGLLGAAMFAVTTFFAAKAAKELDAVVSGG
ncbi:MAG: DUF4328 domain-containing protein [Actinomycetota bacterium]|nr:DUF4328 domain-containing protein [Actinomycetota bacterium]